MNHGKSSDPLYFNCNGKIEVTFKNLFKIKNSKCRVNQLPSVALFCNRPDYCP